jgi:lysine N6-hydroxylase
VAIVGGGQTGAEVFLDLLSRRGEQQPARLIWLSRRPNFLPLDNSPFVNELFFPHYIRYFYDLPNRTKVQMLEEQRLASDGIDERLLQEIYRRLYEIDCLHMPGCRPILLPRSELVSVDPSHQGWRLTARQAETGRSESLMVDIVILCTGYRYEPPRCLDPLAGRLSTDAAGSFVVDENYAIQWDGPGDRRIYVQNGARHSHGIADPNLSLMAWRNAKIINDIAGYKHYEIEDCDSALAFGELPGARQDLPCANPGEPWPATWTHVLSPPSPDHTFLET